QQVLVVLALDVVGQQRRAVDVVHRNAEEALNLLSMQINGQNAVHANGNDHVGDNLGADGDTRGPDATILTGIAEVGNHGGNAVGGRPMHGVGHQQQLHETVIGR